VFPMHFLIKSSLSREMKNMEWMVTDNILEMGDNANLFIFLDKFLFITKLKYRENLGNNIAWACYLKILMCSHVWE